MCKSKKAIAATPPSQLRPSPTTRPQVSSSTSSSSSSVPLASSSSSTTKSSSQLSAVRSSLPIPAILYPFQELSVATNHFLSKPLSSPTPCWKCSLRKRETTVYQLPFHLSDPKSLSHLLSLLIQSHSANLVPLLGASLPSPSHHYIYLVYSFTPSSSSLSSCLRNPHNPSYTPLSTWLSRAQVASDMATGLEYIHLHSPASFHSRLSSSAILVTEQPSIRALISLYGAADLSGDVGPTSIEEFRRGYTAPEVVSCITGVSHQSDVYALGVLLLELISGEEPVKYRLDKGTKEMKQVSVIDKAKKVVRGEEEEKKGKIRRWVDRRLNDSFPVEAAEKLIQIALKCVDQDPEARPNMEWVSGKVSKVFLESKMWHDRLRVPTDQISFSIGVR
ncbi:lysM domain receptor-like kinase 3 [Carex rostrata]